MADRLKPCPFCVRGFIKEKDVKKVDAKLKLCPTCNTTVIMTTCYSDSERHSIMPKENDWYFWCWNKKCKSFSFKGTKQEAIEAWNRRHDG